MTTLVRDQFGEQPIYYAAATQLGEPDFVWATTMRGCWTAGADYSSVRMLPPGTLVHHDDAIGTRGRQTNRVTEHVYYTPTIEPCADSRPTAATKIYDLLLGACAAKASRPDVRGKPAAVLLSGGIDSAAVAYGLLNHGVPLTAYTAVYDERSPDLKSARQVAERLGLDLREVPVPKPTADDLARTISVIEQPWKAQVEIGWPCLVLAEQIAADGLEVVFSGEGSDELWAAHAFSFQEFKRVAPVAADGSPRLEDGTPHPYWYTYRAADFREQAWRNFAREAKTFGAHGIRAVMPFLDQALVEYVLSLSPETARDNSWQAKRPLQEAFKPFLPEWVGRRQKLGFQDGLKIKPDIAEALGLSQRGVASWYRQEFQRQFPNANPDAGRE